MTYLQMSPRGTSKSDPAVGPPPARPSVIEMRDASCTRECFFLYYEVHFPRSIVTTMALSPHRSLLLLQTHKHLNKGTSAACMSHGLLSLTMTFTCLAREGRNERRLRTNCVCPEINNKLVLRSIDDGCRRRGIDAQQQATVARQSHLVSTSAGTASTVS